MDRIERYKTLIKQAICDFAAEMPNEPGVEQEIIFNEETAHYMLMDLGWSGPRRIHGSIIHCDIKDGKIWVQHDGTPEGIIDFFLDNGVPAQDIVICRHPPQYRHLTEFAVG